MKCRQPYSHSTIFMFLLSMLLWGCQQESITQEVQLPKPTDWAKGIVWYQIFPERFFDGNPENGPRASEVPGAELEPGWQIHPWASDWYKMQPWELKRSDKFYDVVFTRRYGGDLIGVIENLDYLKDLGIDGIYFNPVFEAPSLHKYDGSTYHHIDDNFGPDPEGDKKQLAAANETEEPSTWIWTSADSTFLRLIREAHSRGIKIVIDGVFNHTGRQFFAFQDILKKGKDSRYADWYDITSWDDPSTPENEFDYNGWWGVKSLPELAENENGLVKGPREYIFAATRRWMDPNGDGDPSDGIDGWRLDVAEEVAPPFWRDWYGHVHSINPAAITVAEIWGDASEWIEDKRMDATMNYLFARAVVDFFIDRETAVSGTEFNARLQTLHQKYGESIHILWNLMDSHDTDRLPSMIVNPDRNYDRNAGPRDNPGYQVRKPNADERDIQKQIAVFQMTFTGSPMIYYGDEAGMWGADDPDDRKPMVWPEMEFASEKNHPLPGQSRPADPNSFDDKLFFFYKKIIQMRHDNPALATGDYQPLKEAVSENTFGFVRTNDHQQVLTLFNRADHPKRIVVDANALNYSRFKEYFSGNILSAEEGTLEIAVSGRGFSVLISSE